MIGIGGGVFLAINVDMTAIEQPELVTNCETTWAKLKLKSNKDLYIGSFYMPHRNSNDLEQLNQSLSMLNRNGQKNVILGGDFNCPDIDWDNNTTRNNRPDRNIQSALMIYPKYMQNQLVKKCFKLNLHIKPNTRKVQQQHSRYI